MSFASPHALLGLAALPLAAVAYLLCDRRRRRAALAFATAAMLPNVVDRSPRWRRHVPVLVMLGSLAALVVGVARPRASISTKREDATVVLVVDTSRSMAAGDVAPTRLAAAKAAALRFAESLPGRYRVGAVAVADAADVVAAPSRDRALVRTALARLSPHGGTALGDGIVQALRLGREVPGEQAAAGSPRVAPPVSVLLLTDGIEEGGTTSLAQAVARARAARVPVSIVVVGTSRGLVRVPIGGGATLLVPVPADLRGARRVAAATGGHAYLGAGSDLSPVARGLRSRISSVETEQELSFAFGIAGVVLMLVGASLSAAWLRRAP